MGIPLSEYPIGTVIPEAPKMFASNQAERMPYSLYTLRASSSFCSGAR